MKAQSCRFFQGADPVKLRIHTTYQPVALGGLSNNRLTRGSKFHRVGALPEPFQHWD